MLGYGNMSTHKYVHTYIGYIVLINEVLTNLNIKHIKYNNHNK